MAEKLFAEFPPVSTEEWEKVITTDLKGADYEKKLVWKTMDGFSVRPYYRAEDLKNLKHLRVAPGCFPFVRGTKDNNKWLTRQDYCACDGNYTRANAEAIDGLKKDSFVYSKFPPPGSPMGIPNVSVSDIICICKKEGSPSFRVETKL